MHYAQAALLLLTTEKKPETEGMKIITVNCKESIDGESMVKLLQTRTGQNILFFSSHAVQKAVVKEKFSHMTAFWTLEVGF